ncbi:MAG: DUF5667 domain-containing protein, partial [Candidatus Dormibacteraeota bacterium]|nr:DUF5667 domain-containing protein [Candidatus Dormibacteraeota bacterium]
MSRLQEVGAVKPSAASVNRIRATLLQPSTTLPVGGRPGRAVTWRRPAYALAFAVALLALGTTSVFASGTALPDSPLYSVRNLREDVQVRLAGTPAGRASLYATFAGERATQLQVLVHKSGEPVSVVGTLLRDISDRLHHANQEAREDGPESRAAVRQANQQIGQELTQLQQEGDFTGNNGQQAAATLQAVQSEQSGDAGDGDQTHQ